MNGFAVLSLLVGTVAVAALMSFAIAWRFPRMASYGPFYAMFFAFEMIIGAGIGVVFFD